MSGQTLIGDNRQTVPTLPAGCAHVCVTSPPYWNLRSYLPGDHADKSLEIGSEPTPEQFIETMVEVFRGVRHALRDDGLLFVNLGDSYAAGGRGGGGGSFQHDDVGTKISKKNRHRAPVPGYKDGDQMAMPHRVAFALRDDGWYWRDTIIWAKPSPMPSSQNGVRWERCRVKIGGRTRGANHAGSAAGYNPSPSHPSNGIVATECNWSLCLGCDKCRATDGYILRRGRFRTTTAHEYIFVFAKSKGYFADAERCKEKSTGTSHSQARSSSSKQAGAVPGVVRANGSFATTATVETRLPRSVWRVAPEPFKKAHFATYPSDLVRRCLLMAISAKGCCAACGAQYAPVVETERIPTRPALANVLDATGMSNRDPERHIQRSKVLDYWPTCTCNAGEPVPCTVLDPFGGSGTTAQAANWMGCNWIICELNEAYAELSKERIETPPKWARPKREQRIKPSAGQLELFGA